MSPLFKAIFFGRLTICYSGFVCFHCCIIAIFLILGPQITVLPDEPQPQNMSIQTPVIIPSTSTHTSQQSATAKGKTHTNAKGKAKKKQASSSKANGTSLDLKMPTMVALSTNKEPNTDFSPSIFENFGQIFPSDTNLDIGETLEELESSHNPSKLVVFNRQNSSPK